MKSIFLRSTATILLTVFSTGFTPELAAQNTSQVAPPLYEGSLFIDDQGTPAKRGGSLAVLADSNLYLVMHFGGLSQLWGQIDLYSGDPRSGGTINRNLAIGVPGTTAHGGGLNQLITLTPAKSSCSILDHCICNCFLRTEISMNLLSATSSPP